MDLVVICRMPPGQPRCATRYAEAAWRGLALDSGIPAQGAASVFRNRQHRWNPGRSWPQVAPTAGGAAFSSGGGRSLEKRTKSESAPGESTSRHLQTQRAYNPGAGYSVRQEGGNPLRIRDVKYITDPKPRRGSCPSSRQAPAICYPDSRHRHNQQKK